MSKWSQNGKVLCAMGAREHEGTARQALNEEERKAVEKRLAQTRREKIDSGKRSYQPRIR